MPLPPRQISVLRYLNDHKAATVRNVSRDLGINRTAAQNALRLLADKGFASVDRGTFPATWSITDIGSAVVAAAATERDDR